MPKVSEKVRSRIWSLQTQIGKGILDGTHDPKKLAEVLQAFLEKKGEKNEFATLEPEQAINILGQNKVITAEQAAKAWSIEEPQNAAIRYSEATLLTCAEQNKSGEDWRLVYCHGLSLREQRDKRGTSQNSQPCFYKGNTWWLEHSEDKWASHKAQTGYYLINFRGQFSDMNWNEQEQEITKLGKEYERCHEAVFNETILTIFMVNNGERIAEDWWHWGISLDSFGNRVRVGNFDAHGLRVSSGWDDYSHRYLSVALVRKFEN
ncbi:MAG TPA: hypothetical protein ENN28_02460 [Candidatus Uhrbacteria bacterium]|nr:hypothetical protein [Candidatus Uhrbacteria bacterium]